MIIEHPHERARLNALADELGRRTLAAWAEIKAERLAREQGQMAPWVPKIEETEDNG